MGECKFNRAWIGLCKQPTVEGTEYCTEHLIGSHHEGYNKSACCQCGEQATHDCPETFQLVCGAPLCDKEECRIKHHPNHYQLTPKRWAEVYKTEVPKSLEGEVNRIEFEAFRTALLREPVRNVSKALQEYLKDFKMDGVDYVRVFGGVLIVRFDNGMVVRFKSDI